MVASRLAAPPPERRSRRANLGEIARRVFWTETFSPFETALRYHAVARRLFPERYRKLLPFGPAWFLRGDPREPIPRITAVREFADDGGRYVGPFATRSDAEETARFLEDLFDLCRKYDVLRQVPAGQPCEYFEMGRCAAPCDGRVPMSQYQADLTDAMEFAAGRRHARLEALRAAMREAAQGLAFERAAALRGRIDRGATFFQRESLRFVADLGEFRWIVIQRGGPRTRSEKKLRIKPCFVSAAGIVDGPLMSLDELPGAWPAWLSHAQAISAAEAPAAVVDAVERSEWLWLTCHFLFKGERATGLYLAAASLPSIDELRTRIRDTFLKKASEPEEPLPTGEVSMSPPATGESASELPVEPAAPEAPPTPPA